MSIGTDAASSSNFLLRRSKRRKVQKGDAIYPGYPPSSNCCDTRRSSHTGARLATTLGLSRKVFGTYKCPFCPQHHPASLGSCKHPEQNSFHEFAYFFAESYRVNLSDRCTVCDRCIHKTVDHGRVVWYDHPQNEALPKTLKALAHPLPCTLDLHVDPAHVLISDMNSRSETRPEAAPKNSCGNDGRKRHNNKGRVLTRSTSWYQRCLAKKRCFECGQVGHKSGTCGPHLYQPPRPLLLNQDMYGSIRKHTEALGSTEQP